jgi:nitrogen fixation protein FixH
MTASPRFVEDRSVGRAARRPRGWWYPWLFVAGLGLVVAVNGAMIGFAVGSFSGLETARPYERGLDYNRTLAAARAQDAMGWNVVFDAVPRGAAALPRPVAVEARFADRDGRSIDGLTVQAILVRPAVQGHDVTLTLAGQGAGYYAATTDLPLRGQWELRIAASREGATWQSSRRILVP